MDISLIYYYTILILSIGLLIKSCEYLFTIKFFKKGNIFDYSIIGIDMFQLGSFGSIFKKIYSAKGVVSLILLSLLSIAVLFSTSFTSIYFKIALFVCIVVNIVLYYRHSYGLDGADQMSLLILMTLFLCFLFVDNPTIQRVGIYFIALQLSLSYIVSGVAKLFSKQWRSGIAIKGILSTYTYGTSLTRKNLTKNEFLCKSICWATIIIETLFPISLFFDPKITLICLGFGVLFHLSIAIIMGLNDFVWSFAAAYPAFYFLSISI